MGGQIKGRDGLNHPFTPSSAIPIQLELFDNTSQGDLFRLKGPTQRYKPDSISIVDKDGIEISVNDLMAINNGEPRFPAVTVFVPTERNPFIKNPVIVAASMHNHGMIRYAQMLREKGAGDDEALHLAFKSKECVGVDIVIRPDRHHGSIPIIRAPIEQYKPDDWYSLMGKCVSTLSGLGLKRRRIKIFDFSEDTINQALHNGHMAWLFEMPRTLVESLEFIEDSKSTLIGIDNSGLLDSTTAYYGLTGERQVFQSEFDIFIHGITGGESKPKRGDVIEAIGTMAELSKRENNVGVEYRHLAFFGTDNSQFNGDVLLQTVIGNTTIGESFQLGHILGRERKYWYDKEIELVAKSIGKTDFSDTDVSNLKESLRPKLDEPIDKGDVDKLNGLNGLFETAVPENLRAYDPDNDECRQLLLLKLLGDYDREGILKIPGLRLGYFGRGRWLPGAPTFDGGVPVFEEGINTPMIIRNLAVDLAQRYKNLVFLAPFESFCSSSIRGVTHPGREVLLTVAAKKSYDRPFILHFRRMPDMDEATIDYDLKKNTAARLFGCSVPEHFPINVMDEVDGHPYMANFIGRPFEPNVRPVDKLTINQFANPDEVMFREGLMGAQAGRNAIIGRTRFADGDEVFIMSPKGRVRRIRLLDVTDGFDGLETPIEDSTGIYACYLARSMLKAHTMDVVDDDVNRIQSAFTTAFRATLADRMINIESDRDHYYNCFPESSTNLPNDVDIRHKVKMVCDRLVGVGPLSGTDIDAAGRNLESNTRRLYDAFAGFVDDLPSNTPQEVSQKREAVMALDQLMLTHPEANEVVIRTISEDSDFKHLDARQREMRFDLLRIKRTLGYIATSYDQVLDYINHAIERYGQRYAFAYFEDHKRETFPTLNLRGKDAKLLFNISTYPELLRELKQKRYIN